MMEKGQLRCDVNISIRPKGSTALGNRAEIKNMASFRFIMDALEYEIQRQSDILEGGGSIDQETRLFDEEKKITLPMRSKEDAPDYRYFPDPDLVEVLIEKDFIRLVNEGMPELPDQKLHRMIEEFDIPKYDALILTRDKDVSDYFLACARLSDDRKRLSNWIIKELFKLLNGASLPIGSCPVSPEDFARLINLVGKGDLTDRIGREVLEVMFQTGRSPDAIIKEKDLRPISDDAPLKTILEEVIRENPAPLEQLKAGETKPVDFLIGQVMKKTKGKADPKKVRELISALTE
jgi:aspartyl-tRNA(Asn)/glutamyl-tRNA(Gln) amidotransferase subunit B